MNLQVSSTGVSIASPTSVYSGSILVLKDSIQSTHISLAEALKMHKRMQEVLAGLLVSLVHSSPIYMVLYCTAVCHSLVYSSWSTVNPRNCSPTLPNNFVLICTPKLITPAQGQCFLLVLTKFPLFFCCLFLQIFNFKFSLWYICGIYQYITGIFQ